MQEDEVREVKASKGTVLCKVRVLCAMMCTDLTDKVLKEANQPVHVTDSIYVKFKDRKTLGFIKHIKPNITFVEQNIQTHSNSMEKGL